MPDNNSDFKRKVKTLAASINVSDVRECYGVSNCAKFVAGGFLCGIPNIENLNASSDALCVFSKIQLNPNSELHTAILIKKNLPALLEHLERMASSSDDFFADKNNNCALFIWSDGNVYPSNKAKVHFELTAEVLERLGPGVEPDALYWEVYGNSLDAKGGVIEQLETLVGESKFKRVESISPLEGMATTGKRSQSLGVLSSAFKNECEIAKLETTLPQVYRYASSLFAKSLLILTGLSGSGKTKLAQAFSKWICAEGSQSELIAVGADWTSNENLLGYPDALSPKSYRKPDNGALDLILRAQDDLEHPYFLILDEMNLSHVERYFADFLSAMESGEAISLHDGDEDELWDGVPGNLKIPKNLFVIGTVNVDETTYMFSPKVLDRANVIEFRVSDEEMKSFLANPVKPELDAIAGQGVQYAKAFVAAAKRKDFTLVEQGRVADVLMSFFDPLQKAGAEFGYRTAHEISRFIYFHKELSGEGWDLNVAMDAAIMQKLLPKLHGSKRSLQEVLTILLRLCLKSAARPEEVKTPIGAELITRDNALYWRSLEKLGRMQRRLKEHGFTSFAEA